MYLTDHYEEQILNNNNNNHKEWRNIQKTSNSEHTSDYRASLWRPNKKYYRIFTFTGLFNFQLLNFKLIFYYYVWNLFLLKKVL